MRSSASAKPRVRARILGIAKSVFAATAARLANCWLPRLHSPRADPCNPSRYFGSGYTGQLAASAASAATAARLGELLAAEAALAAS
ncbi:hypothetical protein MAHJHV57_54430 [Mycobacterium avium subsp. hominissuis]